MRLVLDTNVWIDWLVFDDPAVVPLAAALGAGAARVFGDARAEDELRRALGYRLGRVTLDVATQAACLARARRVMHTGWTPAPPMRRLPDCRDADDQKFLELAQACRADALLTRDRALLELGRRGSALPFAIATPRTWFGACDA